MYKKVAIFLFALFLGIFIFFTVLQKAGFEVIESVLALFFSFKGLSLIFLTFLIFAVGAFRWKMILKTEGKDVPFFKLYLFFIQGFTVTFLTPVSLFGGEGLRAVLLKKEIGDARVASSSVIIDKMMDITAQFFFFISGIILFLTYGNFYEETLLFYGTIAALLFALALFFFYYRVMRKKRILYFFVRAVGANKKYLTSTKNGNALLDVENQVISFFSSKKKELLKGMSLSFLRHFLFNVRIALLLFFIFQVPYIKESLSVYGLTILSYLLPLPASLGGLEAISYVGFNVMGMGFAEGTAYAVLLRGVDLAFCAVGIVFIVRFFYLSISSYVARFIDRIFSNNAS